ncbi:MobA/MobL family protein [Radicibacter daui]|uniref:MobA/MobL family protein n=1 Tax=Radicibacter daui TaxID=3064829 RepID=UPI0040468B41
MSQQSIKVRRGHIDFDVVQPKRGHELIKIAAYSRCGRMTKPDGKVYDFSRKAEEHRGGLLLLPPGVRVASREAIWQAAAAAETRIDGQPARLIEIEIPREIPERRRMDFVRWLVQPMVTDERLAVQLDIHSPLASDGQEQPHAHIILSRRTLGPGGFSERKTSNADWWGAAIQKRKWFEDRANEWLEAALIPVRLDYGKAPAETHAKDFPRRMWEAWKRDPDCAAAAPVAEWLAANRQIKADLRQAEKLMAEIAALEEALLEIELGITAADQIKEARKRCHLAKLLNLRAGYDAAKTAEMAAFKGIRERNGALMYFLKDGGFIRATEDKVTLKGRQLDATAVKEIIAHAIRDGWTEINVSGTNEERDRLAFAAGQAGIQVMNHAISPTRHAALMAEADGAGQRAAAKAAAEKHRAEKLAGEQLTAAVQHYTAREATTAKAYSEGAADAAEMRRLRVIRSAMDARDPKVVAALAANDFTTAGSAAEHWHFYEQKRRAEAEAARRAAQEATAPPQPPEPAPAPAFVPSWVRPREDDDEDERDRKKREKEHPL